MGYSLKQLLALALALMLFAVPALAATDSTEIAIEKISRFYDWLIERNVDSAADHYPPDGFPSPEQVQSNAFDLTDYLYVDFVEGDEGFSYSLSLAYADLPEDLNADDLYALFVKACSNREMPLEEAQALVAEVRGNIARVAQYAWMGGKDTDEFTISIMGSTTDSEEFLVIVQYP